MSGSTWRGVGILILAIAALGAGKPVQLKPGPVKELATGKILIAERDLPDPNFSNTIVLIVDLNAEGTVGLVLNRRSELTLASVFDQVKPPPSNAITFYLGGPVQTDAVIGLVRLEGSSKTESRHIFGDVYLVSGREQLEGAVTAGANPSRFRAYLGYAGWSPGQLERETAQGSWRVLKSVSSTIFDPHPETLWDRLIHQTDGLSARSATSPPGTRRTTATEPQRTQRTQRSSGA